MRCTKIPQSLIYNTEDFLLMTRGGLRNVTGSGSYDGGTAWAGRDAKQISDRQHLVPRQLPTSVMPPNLDDFHLREGETAGAHSHPTVT